MAQNPLAATIARIKSGASFFQAQPSLDVVYNLSTQNGGQLSLLNVGVATVIKATPGRLRRIVIITPGTTSGAFSLNDCATTGTVAASNLFWTMAYNAAANLEGAIFTLDWPCLVGIVLSAVPTAGTPLVTVSYD